MTSSARSFDRLPEGWSLFDEPPSQWDIDHGIVPEPAIVGPQRYGDLAMIVRDAETGQYFFPGHGQTRGFCFSTLADALAWLEGLT